MKDGKPYRARVVINDVADDDDGSDCFGFTLGESFDESRALMPTGIIREDREGHAWALGWDRDTGAALRAANNLGDDNSALLDAWLRR